MRLITAVIFCLSMAVAVRSQNGLYKRRFARRMREFSGSMHTIMVQGYDEPKNTIYSPLSVYSTTAMLAKGAVGNTQHEILRGMRLSHRSDNFTEPRVTKRVGKLLTESVESEKNGTYSLGNAMFYKKNYEIKEEFQTTLEEQYKAEVYPIDFSNADKSAATINDWISTKTRGKITDLVSSDNIKATTRLVLVNAIYFKAKWMKSFKKEQQLMNFVLQNGENVEVKAMSATSKYRRNYIPSIDMTFIAIPYKGKKTYFVVGLPGKSSDLSAFNRNAMKVLGQFTKPSSWPRPRATVILPRLTIEVETDVKPIMQALGIRQVFIPGQSDLSNISDEPLSVSDVLHKARINVNEKGTEAAAATAAITIGRSTGGVKTFKFNKPFFFGIYSDLAEVFTFTGQVADPRSGNNNQEGSNE